MCHTPRPTDSGGLVLVVVIPREIRVRGGVGSEVPNEIHSV